MNEINTNAEMVTKVHLMLIRMWRHLKNESMHQTQLDMKIFGKSNIKSPAHTYECMSVFKHSTDTVYTARSHVLKCENKDTILLNVRLKLSLSIW